MYAHFPDLIAVKTFGRIVRCVSWSIPRVTTRTDDKMKNPNTVPSFTRSQYNVTLSEKKFRRQISLFVKLLQTTSNFECINPCVGGDGGSSLLNAADLRTFERELMAWEYRRCLGAMSAAAIVAKRAMKMLAI